LPPTDKLNQEQFKRLCRSIARVCDLTVIDPDKGHSKDSVLPDDLKIDSAVMLGTVLAIEALWEKIGLKKSLSSIGSTGGLRAMSRFVDDRASRPMRLWSTLAPNPSQSGRP